MTCKHLFSYFYWLIDCFLSLSFTYIWLFFCTLSDLYVLSIGGFGAGAFMSQWLCMCVNMFGNKDIVENKNSKSLILSDIILPHKILQYYTAPIFFLIFPNSEAASFPPATSLTSSHWPLKHCYCSNINYSHMRARVHLVSVGREEINYQTPGTRVASSITFGFIVVNASLLLRSNAA